MEQITIDNLKVQPDQKTGKKPTEKQMEILLALNPFEFNRTYKDVAAVLRISELSVKYQMSKLKKQCPIISEKFRKVKLVMKKELSYSIYEPVIPFSSFDNKRHKTSMLRKNKLCGCGLIKIPENQDECYRCWQKKDRKKNPKFYEKDRMFPANGPTPGTIVKSEIHRFKNIDKDFTVDDLPVPTDLILEELC